MRLSSSRIHSHNVNDMDFIIPGVSLPESDLRSSAHIQQSVYQCPDLSQNDFALHHSFLDSNGNHDMLPNSIMDPQYPIPMSDHELAAALASYQPCDDCTPATKTTIPHHHHTSGRLAGASAQLDGHFCCSWLVHGQPCFLCFETAEALDNHIKNDHAGKDGTYRCLWQNCSKHDHSSKTVGPTNFGNKPKLMRHVHSHTGYKPFLCPHPDCDKGFVTKEQLKNHETTHTKDRKYKCNQCDKAFAVKSALTTHIAAVHENQKTHICEVCGKAFADSSNLSKHKQMHYRDGGIRKQRRKRGASSAASTRSSSSIYAPTPDPATPFLQLQGAHDFVPPPISPSLMPPPAPKLSAPSPFATSSLPVSYSTMSLTSTTSSPPPESFDPNCYCCEQRCPPPEGVPTPCTEADDCDRDGFCDLPECSPEAPPSPCTMAEECCDRAGFCDLPECLVESSCGSPTAATSGDQYEEEPLMSHHQQVEQLRNFQLPQQQNWDEFFDGGSFQDYHRPYSQLELEEQFTHMHGS